ncbi:hypothetical protein FQR65_LT17398 [Abscondita terminalis]|nr:hypothetical protein FQR65_LT17398 [Abscondita terminalis]
MGCDLIALSATLKEIIPRLAAKYEVNEVFHHREVASRETIISENVETALWKLKINLKHFIGHTLYHKEDLPFPIRGYPQLISWYQKENRKRKYGNGNPSQLQTMVVTHPIWKKRRYRHWRNWDIRPKKYTKTAKINNPIHLRGGEDEALKKVEEKIRIQGICIGYGSPWPSNVLANIMGKSYKTIFSEFEGKMLEEDPEIHFGGDVKYHLGFSSDVKTDDGKSVHLSLAPNPSHLETVDAIHRSHPDVQTGWLTKPGERSIIVINNQVGFTTNFKDARSSHTVPILLKVTLSPVFHVNGDDVEALVYAINLAVEYRQKYKTDVFIDLLCYRRFGHNEADEPKFTQPLLYKAIEKHANPREIYAQKLLDQGSVDANLAKEMEKEFRSLLTDCLDEAKESQKLNDETPMFSGAWKGLRQAKAN